jgi:ribosomal protein L11 methyltransferase
MDEYTRRVGQRLLIIPSWYYDSYAHELTLTPTDLPLVLNPGEGWGTGSHPTTQMCLLFIEKYLQPNDRLLDIGCGSGILSLAAAKFGAGSILAIDIDPEAETATRENMVRNNLADKIEFRLGSLESVLQATPPVAPFQLIAGNIFAYLIIPFLQEGLAMLLAPGGKLILSGILERQADDVIEALNTAGLTVIEQQEIDGWVGIVAGKIQETY